IPPKIGPFYPFREFGTRLALGVRRRKQTVRATRHASLGSQTARECAMRKLMLTAFAFGLLTIGGVQTAQAHGHGYYHARYAPVYARGYWGSRYPAYYGPRYVGCGPAYPVAPYAAYPAPGLGVASRNFSFWISP